MEGQNTFGEFLKNYRNERNLSTNDIHVKTGVSQPYLSQIENGKKPSIKILKKISEGLKVNENYLMQLAGYITEEDINNLYNELANKEKIFKHLSSQYSTTYEALKNMTSKFTDLVKQNNNEKEINELSSLVEFNEKKLISLKQRLEMTKFEIEDIITQLDTSLNGIENAQMSELITDYLDFSTSSIDLSEVLSSDIEITFGEKTLTDSEKNKMLSVLKILFDN